MKTRPPRVSFGGFHALITVYFSTTAFSTHLLAGTHTYKHPWSLVSFRIQRRRGHFVLYQLKREFLELAQICPTQISIPSSLHFCNNPPAHFSRTAVQPVRILQPVQPAHRSAPHRIAHSQHPITSQSPFISDGRGHLPSLHRPCTTPRLSRTAHGLGALVPISAGLFAPPTKLDARTSATARGTYDQKPLRPATLRSMLLGWSTVEEVGVLLRPVASP